MLTGSTNGAIDVKRQFQQLLALVAIVLVASSCSAGGPPEMLAYNGPYAYAEVLVTVIMPGGDIVEYGISCRPDSATVDGTDKINANDACVTLASNRVQARLVGGKPTGQLCSTIDPQVGELQLIGVVEEGQFNTFVDRKDSCGQGDWDELLQFVALAPSDI